MCDALWRIHLPTCMGDFGGDCVKASKFVLLLSTESKVTTERESAKMSIILMPAEAVVGSKV